ncbi:hypothetical protein PIB30_087713 [Stylosanthes scabra]|uniref:Protein FAR1-RELATED SEQUENCE n=1 Tax=Stylosanthes scabra TaxID=79078 RepID=A0ABU6TVH6_9FABA|nr:hypothetical protein [Stylosanthes scabra]
MQERVTSISSQYILPRWSKNISRKHTHIRCIQDANRSDDNMNIFRELCCYFFNVAQDFVTNVVEENILRVAIDSARLKLKKHRESNREVTHEECPIVIDKIRGPHRVPTRGRPSTTRLGAALDNSIKNSVRKCKHKHADEHNKEAS